MQNRFLHNQTAFAGIIFEYVPCNIDSIAVFHHAGSTISVTAWRMLVRAEGKYITVKIRIFAASQLDSAGKLDLLSLSVKDEGGLLQAPGLERRTEIIRAVRINPHMPHPEINRKLRPFRIKSGPARRQNFATLLQERF
ncbi:hypothetical protein D3C74_347350 [compost metagenome]